jgi:serine/threonine protein phosphatase PrpC
MKKDKYYLANCGDSQAVYFRTDKKSFEILNSMHRTSCTKE